MSVSGAGDDQYHIIQHGLVEGNRIVYNKNSRQFESVTRSRAKQLANDANYITKLEDIKTHEDLKSKVKEFLEDHEINPTQKEDLKLAFEERANRLSKRKVFFWEKGVRDKAVLELRGFKDTIDLASQQRSKISSNVPPSSPGPTQLTTHAPQEAVQTPAMPKSQEREKMKREEAQPKQVEREEAQTTAPRSTPQTSADPASTQHTVDQKPKKPSRVHDFVNQPRKRIEGEQLQPKLPETVDAGDNKTLKALTPEQKAQLKEEIDRYLNGKGKIPSKPQSGAKNGLTHNIIFIEGRLKAQSNAVKKLEGPKKELTRLKTEHEKMVIRLEEMEKAERENQSYYLFTTKVNEDTGDIEQGVAIRYYSQKEIEETRSSFLAVKPEDKTSIQAQLAKEKGHNRTTEDPIPPQRTLAMLIEAQKSVIKAKEEDITKKQREVKSFQKEVDAIEGETNGDVSFSEYADYVKDRKELVSKYEAMLRWMGEVEKPKSEADHKKDYYNGIMQDIPYLDVEREMLESLGTQKNIVMNPDLSSLLNTDEIMSDSEIKKANEKPAPAQVVTPSEEPPERISAPGGPPPPPPAPKMPPPPPPPKK